MDRCPLERISVTVSTRWIDVYEDELGPFCVAVSRFATDDSHKTWRIEGLLEEGASSQAAACGLAQAASKAGAPQTEIQISQVRHKDWVAEGLRSFTPIEVGRYFVHGSHFDHPAPLGRIGIQIDAGAAFGVGGHGSTKGCLIALDGLAFHRFDRFFDMGCGSGILAIAMAKTWKKPVLAVDIDPTAVAVAAGNARINRVAGWVRVIEGHSPAAASIRRNGPYDLVTANILANPLCAMAKDLVRSLAPRGVLVLSGFLARDVRRVQGAYGHLGCRLVRRIDLEGWQTLVLEKAPPPEENGSDPDVNVIARRNVKAQRLTRAQHSIQAG